RVVQIVGGSLKDDANDVLTNFESDRSPADYAQMYRRDGLVGGHVIALGPGNHEAAIAALNAYPGGMHMGGGIRPDNAHVYLDAGASHVIVTSYVFADGQLSLDRLRELRDAVGRERLVLDLSCRHKDDDYWVVMDRWQRFTDTALTTQSLAMLADYCAEFLVHGVDVEGLRLGIEAPLVTLLGESSPLPVTYAGGVRSLEDLDTVRQLGRGRVDVTIGSALDIFGGSVAYADVVAWHRRQQAE
ncbi:MAG: phosphoribosylformimino-5-aminoimidazole carboxamide ribotide isomerase, partial [Caldilineaceae bacterium]